jgi:hypothetical protein
MLGVSFTARTCDGYFLGMGGEKWNHGRATKRVGVRTTVGVKSTGNPFPVANWASSEE